MKHKLKNIFMPLLVAVFGAFLPTDSAHAVGAVYETDATIEMSVDLDISGQTGQAAILNGSRWFLATLSGTFRDAVVDQPSDAAAASAAVAACNSGAGTAISVIIMANTASIASLPINIPEGAIAVSDINIVNVNIGTCAAADAVGNDEYVAVATGVRVFVDTNSLDPSNIANDEIIISPGANNEFLQFASFAGIGDTAAAAGIAAHEACTDVYSRAEDRTGLGTAAGGMCGDTNSIVARPGDIPAPVVINNTVFMTVAGSGGTTVKDDDTAENLAYAGVGILAIGAAALYISGGDLGLFNFSPDYGYSLTESGYSANVGGRMDFRKDGWHLYHSAGQTNRNGEFGEFRFQSGGEYRADIWTAAFSESVRGETADYDLSLSANFGGGIWNVSPVYRLHSRFDEGESKTRNSLNLEGFVKYDRWTISPSAGFRWENADDFADNARFNINLVRKL